MIIFLLTIPASGPTSAPARVEGHDLADLVSTAR
jgi:hypothetical protein